MSALATERARRKALIGHRLRERRRELNLTLDTLATRTGLTKSFLSAVERDQTSPSVASLLAICDVLALPVGALFDATPEQVVRAWDRQPIEFGGSGLDDFLVSPKGTARFQAVLSEMAPGASGGDELYRLAANEVFVFCLTGQVALRLEGEVITLGPGDTLTYDPRQPHTFFNAAADRPASALFVIMPALS
ncbi:helix-turn-helix domain-containing protein [Oleomonas cavernae]|uniref:Helix-turn-helix domain-containing protein n=1 Tax=Oleomonas cavernae TaxID=2320859 RepID=A0A418WIS6_9PROT|nr:XRE family transcriptional regulator [Oleomonas cavernae]RJF89924.1 helix-turn-helix domain-containing protein [Oleomonas cavernae]